MEIEAKLNYPVFTKYVYLLQNLDRIFRGIDILEKSIPCNSKNYDLALYLKNQKDQIEKFVLDERSI